MTGERTTILDIRDLQITLPPGGDRPYALSDFNLTVGKGEIVCLVGESGSGKSLAANAVMRLLPEPHVRVSQGTIALNGEDLLSLSEAEMRAIRGDRMAMIFQEPMTALNPQKTVGWQIDEVLKLVKLEGFADFYPHQLSGGMAQRAALARALVNDPKLLLLDEPFGKLDSLTRLRMQNELLDLWKSAGFTALLVTHDVEEALLLADRVIVLSDRPASIVAEVRVDQPHPRRRDDARLVALRGQLLGKLGISHDV